MRSTVTASVINELPKKFELPQEIERNAYFVASEALANAAKHAGANTIVVRVATHRVLDDDSTWLDVTVTRRWTWRSQVGCRSRHRGPRGPRPRARWNSRGDQPEWWSHGRECAHPAHERHRHRRGGILSMTLRIAVADDSVLLREGLIRVLTEGGFEVVGGFGDADALLAEIDTLDADVVVLDVRMPPTFRDEGVRAVVQLRDRFPSLGILLLSQYVEVTYAQELLSSGRGGVGYLLKDRVASLVELRDAVERSRRGRHGARPGSGGAPPRPAPRPARPAHAAGARGDGTDRRGPHERCDREGARGSARALSRRT